MNWIKKAWGKIETKPKIVMEFGFILSGFFALAPLIVGVIRFFFAHQKFHYRLSWLILAFAAFLINIFLPSVMTFVYRAAMFVAQGISWPLTRLVLGILFYLVITPLSITMRLLGKDILDQNIDRSATSYWNKRTTRAGIEHYERLF